jgi:hypothetical protein
MILLEVLQPVGGILAAKSEEELSSDLRIHNKYEETAKTI